MDESRGRGQSVDADGEVEIRGPSQVSGSSSLSFSFSLRSFWGGTIETRFCCFVCGGARVAGAVAIRLGGGGLGDFEGGEGGLLILVPRTRTGFLGR